jgi:hypothetical protein
MGSDAETIVRKLIEEGFNQGNLEVVDAVTSPDLVEHQNFGPNHAPGAAGARAVVESLRQAFPDSTSRSRISPCPATPSGCA